MDIWAACHCLQSRLMANQCNPVAENVLSRRETGDEDLSIQRWLSVSHLRTSPEPQGRNETAHKDVRHATQKARGVIPWIRLSCETFFHALVCPEHFVCMGSRPLCSLAARSGRSALVSVDVPGIKLSGAHPGSGSSQRDSLVALPCMRLRQSEERLNFYTET